MKTRIAISICALILGACSQQSGTTAQPGSTITLAGQERGNGTDYIGQENLSAWFSGAGKSFTYCVAVTSDFGMTEDTARQIVTESLHMWADYASQRAPTSAVVFNGKLSPQCSSDIDLKFELGGAAPSGTAIGIQHVGAAIRRSYNWKTKWSQGIVWVAAQGSIHLDQKDATYSKVFPDWSEPNVLRAVLLHELGHVFGVEHVRFTIMDSNLSNILAFKYHGGPNLNYRPKFLEGIDAFQELLPSNTYVGTLGLPVVGSEFKHGCAGNDAENFETLTGEKPQGPISATFNILGNDEYKLNVSDSHRSFDFPMKMVDVDVPFAASGLGQRVFKVDEANAEYRWSGAKTLVFETKLGRRLYVSYLQNLTSSFGIIDGPYREYVATGQTLILITKSGPRYLFMTSYFLSGIAGEGAPKRIRSCP